MSFRPPGYCPNCGEYVEAGSLACESCGSCPETGWNEDSAYDGLDLPEGDEETLGEGKAGNRFLGTVVSLALVAILVYVFVFR